MAGTIIVDRIESDASYASTINVAGQITFSNTVNFGAYNGTAPVAGLYLPTTNNLVFTTASTERMRIDSAGNVGIGTSSPSQKLTIKQAGDGNLASQGIGILASGSDTQLAMGYRSDLGGVVLSATYVSTGSYQPMLFRTSDTERMRIDSSGNVGIGTSSPAANLDVQATTGPFVRIKPTTVTSYGYLGFNNTGGDFNIGRESSGGGSLLTGSTGYASVLNSFGAYPMQFGTNGVLRMTIDSSGNLLVGGTGVIYYSKILSQFDGLSKYGYTANDTSGVANVGFVAFAVNGTTNTGAIGTITRNGSSNAVLYNTTSDQRLKENIADADAALGVVEAIKVRKYDWKEGGQHENFGFVAQELAQVVNNVVSKGRTEEDMWSLDYGKLTPLLVKAIQEQQALITALTARIEALESK